MNRIKKGVAIMVFLVFAFAAALPAVADPSAEAEETGQTTEANATEIASLVINMPAPVAGQAAPSKDVVTVLMPSSEGSLEVAPVSVTSIQWRSDAGASAQADENQTALIIEASGFPYTATVTLTANSGYKFASEVAITSKNGETVSSPVSTDGSTSLSVDITFNAASSPSTSIASVTIDLAKPAVGAVPPTSAELAAKDSEDSELSDAVGLKSIEWKDKDGKVPEKITSDGFPYTAQTSQVRSAENVRH